MARFRALHVVNWLARAGLEVQLMRSLVPLAQAGVDVDVLCLGPERELDQDFRNQGARIFRLAKPASCLKAARDIQGLLHQQSFSVVHSHFGHTSGGIALGCKRQSIPCIVSLHSCEPLALFRWKDLPVLKELRNLWLSWHRHLVDRHAARIVGQSRVNLDAFEPRWQQMPQKFKLIRNGISIPHQKQTQAEARQYLGLAQKRPLLLHVGNFTQPKNHAGLFCILRKIFQKRPDCLAVLVGGEGGQTEQDSVRDLMQPGNIVFAGPQTNVWPYYFAADLFLFPSTSEGLGNVLLEAQSVGLPFVASDIPAHREATAPVLHRHLFPLPDYDLAAQKALEQLQPLTSNDAEIEAGRCHVLQHFSIARMAQETAALYREIAG